MRYPYVSNIAWSGVKSVLSIKLASLEFLAKIVPLACTIAKLTPSSKAKMRIRFTVQTTYGLVRPPGVRIPLVRPPGVRIPPRSSPGARKYPRPAPQNAEIPPPEEANSCRNF